MDLHQAVQQLVGANTRGYFSNTKGGISMDVSKVYQYAVKSVPMMPRALIGPGAAELAGAEAAGMGLKHVLFITSGLRALTEIKVPTPVVGWYSSNRHERALS